MCSMTQSTKTRIVPEIFLLSIPVVKIQLIKNPTFLGWGLVNSWRTVFFTRPILQQTQTHAPMSDYRYH